MLPELTSQRSAEVLHGVGSVARRSRRSRGDVQSRRITRAHVLHEQLLSETVRLLGVVIVIALALLANLRESLNAQRSARFAERLERVFALTRRDDVTDEPKEIVFAWRVGQV